MRLIDPSGHCGADASEGLINQCEDLRDDLEGYYQITINGLWTHQELSILRLSLQDIESGLSGVTYFHEIFANTTYNRIREWRGTDGQAAEALPDGNQVDFYNETFTLGEEQGRWVGIHESVHVWDIRSGYQLMFIHAFATNAQCAAGTGCGLTRGDPQGSYIPGGVPVSEYAWRNPGEDVAESMTAYLFRGDPSDLVVAVADQATSPRRYQWAAGFIYQWNWYQENHGR